MASTINVKIAPLPRGAYSSSATYAKLDVVSYNGSSYMAIKSVPTGTVPTNTAYWQLLVQAPTISDGSITTDKIADGAISEDKLDGDVIDLIKGAYPSDVEKGNIASFPDGSEMPVEDLKVHLEPIQDLNGYDSPWVGGAGKNILSSTWESGSYGATGSKINDSTKIRTASAISVEPNTTYTLSFAVTRQATGLVCFYTDSAFISRTGMNADNPTFTTPSTCTRITLVASAESDSTEPKAQLEKGSTATAWTPYENICPITGHTETNVVRTGKNLTNKSGGVNNIVLTRVKKGVTYTYSCKNIGAVGINLKKDSNTGAMVKALATMSNQHPFLTFTADEDFNLFLNGYGSDGWTFAGATSEHQVEVGSSATSYEPYQSNTYNIPLNQTVYGGTLDITTGVLTVDKGAVDLGSLTWIYESAVPRFYSTGINSLVKRPPNNVVVIGAISSAYTEVTFNQLYTTQKANGSFAFGDTGTLSIINTAYTNASTFKTAMSGVYIVYPLATPQTYQLTPTQVTTLLGHNNMWADSGEVEVKYLADTSLYIQKLTGSTEDDMVANQNISANKYFMVGNELYYSTTAIASGETIVVGSNCTKTNLAEALNALNQ